MKIKIGTFYGYNFSMDIPAKEYKKIGLDDQHWQERFKSWIETERQSAVNNYKSERFMKELENLKIKKWYHLF